MLGYQLNKQDYFEKQRCKTRESMVTKPQAKKAEYGRIRSKPFTRIHGRPARNCVDRLVRKPEDAALETQIPSFDWVGEHELLVEVVGDQQYQDKTNKGLRIINRAQRLQQPHPS